jgi:hypothetical protein
LLLAAALAVATPAWGQRTTAFSYQGLLQLNGQPVNEQCDFGFELFDAATGGTQAGETLGFDDVQVRNGLFSLELNFGADVFPGNRRWLEVRVRCPSQGTALITLAPRQEVLSAPYATSAPLELRDPDGTLRFLTALGFGSPVQGFFARNGDVKLELDIDPVSGSGEIEVHDAGDDPTRVRIDGGSVALVDSDSARRLEMALVPGDGTPERALFTLRNRFGSIAAEIVESAEFGEGIINADEINGGEVNADVINATVKNFVADHPTRYGFKIVYTSLEGAEAGIYHRGTVSLRQGHAAIELPEHFALLANLDTITVQLTPRSLRSKGVAAGALQEDRIEVGELNGGTGSYDVDFIVHAVRRGFEERQTVVRAERLAPRAASASTGSVAGGTASR